MGLNMDVTHIAFASLNKFDGTSRRNLRLSEFSQIAGRAGRHMSDGTFGVTGEAKEFDPSIIEQVENHRFDIIKQIQWRNSVLDYSSFESLLDSLNIRPNASGLVKVPQPNDEKFLTQLASEEAVRNRLTNENSIQCLWEVCQIPNFRKQMGGGHVNLLSNIYKSLTDTGKLDTEWIEREVNYIDNIDGDIGLLVDRIANIRIWTYVSNRSDWLLDPKGWQGRTRKIEDRLSDVLHERLTQRFVDQRTSILVKKLKDIKSLKSAVNSQGDVVVEGHFVGQIKGFVFISDTTEGTLAGRTVSAAAYRALANEIQRRVIELKNTKDSGFELNSNGKIFWIRSAERQLVAGLIDGSDKLKPGLKVVPSDLLEERFQNKIKERLHAWLNSYIRLHLMPLIKARDRNLTGAARGLVFQLVENGGVLGKRQAIGQLKALSKADYSILRHMDIKVGRHEIFFPKLLRPRSAGLSALLWAIKNKIKPIPELPSPGCVSIIYDGSVPLDFMLAGGFKRAGELLVRVDILERVAGKLKSLSMNGPFEIGSQILNLLGCSAKQASSVAYSFGYVQKKFGAVPHKTAVPLFINAKNHHPNLKNKQKLEVSGLKNKNRLHVDIPIEESPFAKLRQISIR